MDSPKAMPQHAFELPVIFSSPISRVPFAFLRLAQMPAAFIVRLVCECEPALSFHGVSFPLAFIPVLVAEGMPAPA